VSPRSGRHTGLSRRVHRCRCSGLQGLKHDLRPLAGGGRKLKHHPAAFAAAGAGDTASSRRTVEISVSIKNQGSLSVSSVRFGRKLDFSTFQHPRLFTTTTATIFAMYCPKCGDVLKEQPDAFIRERGEME
jgi:hypothetical protein